MSVKPISNKNRHITRLRSERDQLMAELAALRDDLKMIQAMVQDKQSRLHRLNQDIANKTRHASAWYIIDSKSDLQTLPMQAAGGS